MNRRVVSAAVVAAALLVAVTSAPRPVAASGRQAPEPTAAPAPGVGLSPEVAEVPASSAELDAAVERLAELVDERADQSAELSEATATIGADTIELTATRSLAERRAEQADKAAVVAERSRAALRALTADRFVEGDRVLEGLDPALTSDARNDLARRWVLGQVGTARLIEEQRYTAARSGALADQAAELRDAVDGLEAEISALTRRSERLQASLAELGPRIADAERARDAARLSASIDGTDLSALALDAYWRAAQYIAATDPDCGLSWSVLAGIGRTESRHGTYRGAVLGTDGVVQPPIYGPDLDGSNTFAVVPDSDGGSLDATARTDRAVGPMQFLPGTWRTVGTDLTGDGTADPQNLFDAAAAAGVYLCRSGPGLGDAARLRRAVLTYNRSQEYADIVDERARGYAATVPLG